MQFVNRIAAGLCLATGLIAAAAGPAEARGSIRYNAGDLAITTLVDLGDRQELRLDGSPARLGWLHREYSLFEGPFWVFDEQGYVLFTSAGDNHSYAPIPAGEAVALARAAGVELPETGSPLSFWDRWAGAIVLVGLIVVLIFAKLRRRA